MIPQSKVSRRYAQLDLEHALLSEYIWMERERRKKKAMEREMRLRAFTVARLERLKSSGELVEKSAHKADDGCFTFEC